MTRGFHRASLMYWAFVAMCMAALPASSLSAGQQKPAQNSPSTVPEKQEAENIEALEPGKPIEGEIVGHTKHLYGVTISEGQFADISVDQRGVDVVVKLADRDHKPLAEFDMERRPDGQERVGVFARSTGSYELEVEAKYPRYASGHYEIQLLQIRSGNEQDRAVFEAHELSLQAVKQNENGKYDEAIKLIQQALALSEKTLGTDNAYTGYLMNQLGSLQQTKGDYQRAIATLQQAIEINTKVVGPQNPQTATSLDNLGIVYRGKDDLTKAEQYYRQALEIDEKALGTEHPLVAQCLMQISLARQTHGDFESALSLLQRAVAIVDKTLEPDDFLSIAIVHNLGNLYLDRGDLDHAEPLTQRSMEMIEKKYGSDSPRMVLSLRNLGSIARMRKQYVHARDLFARAEVIQEKTLGPNHPQTAALFINIGNVYKDEGDYAHALELYQKALGILENVAGPYDTLTRMSLSNLANAYRAIGNDAQAIAYQSRVYQIADKQTELTLATGSERQKLAFTDMMAALTDRTISLHVQEMPADRSACELATLAVLRRKGRVLDAMAGSVAALRQHMKPEDQKLIEELGDTTGQLAKLVLGGPGKIPKPEYEEQLQSLQQKREELEARISASTAGYYEGTAPVTLDSVKAAIPPDAVLIEFAVYRPFDPKAADTPDEKPPDPRYVAYAIRNGGSIQWKDLGKAENIDRAVKDLRDALRDPGRRDVRRLARVLDEHVLEPLRAAIGDAKRLLVSPDGELSLVPFEALVNERGRFAVEDYSISYLTSGRDLLRMETQRASKSGPLVIADPSFGEPAPSGEPKPVLTAKLSHSNTQDLLSRRRSVTTGESLSTIYFAPLEGTALEARSIHALFPQARVLTGHEASAGNLKRVDAPSILHIATHGFFLDDAGVEPGPGQSPGTASHPPQAESSDIQSKNPLLRSGLALAGANLNRQGPDTGILTALEASNLNLWGTKLVTLSACDTGIGEVKNGEGVYGLRRAFLRAGAETLVMSLWPISDHVTREMMTAYYAGLKKGLGRGEALRQAELAMLKRKGREHPFYWASFIQSGEWANLDGKR